MNRAINPEGGVAGSGSSRARDRWLAIGVAVALHLAILASFLGTPPALKAGEGLGDGAMEVSLAGMSKGGTASPHHAAAARPAAAKPAPPPVVAIRPRSVLETVSRILAIPLVEQPVTPQPLYAAPAAVIATTAPAPGSTGAACDIEGTVQSVLRSDPDTHRAILLIPRQERSAANAVMMWNGQWIESNSAGGAASFATVRSAIRGIVTAAAPGCRDQDIAGPRFIFVDEPQGAVILVIGSDIWRWSALLDGSRDGVPLEAPKKHF